jgi:putative pyruvate formate lyase activating enzyme
MLRKDFQAAYRITYEKRLLPARIAEAEAVLKACGLCPRKCGSDRTSGEKGFCQAGQLPEISSYGPHFGEERPLVGRQGSGTIFMTHCNLGCLFCQNYPISRLGQGQSITSEQFSRIMIHLQEQDCHNINFVSPSHFAVQILQALPSAIERGLTVPLVYNTGGYDAAETLKWLDGVFDIYMPDFKFTSEAVADRYALARDYPEVAQAALKEMHRQVGDLVMDEEGIAVRGLLVRHLVLPEGLAGTKEAMHFLATEISKDTYVNLMDQYHPCGDVLPRDSPLRRRITRREFDEALHLARREGLHRLESN